MARKRISTLLIARNFPPLVGGMERVNTRLFQGLAVRGKTVLLGPRGASAFALQAMDVIEVPAKRLVQFLFCTLWASLRIVWRLRPAMVIAGSGLTAPFAWLVARLTGAPCVTYLHGLDIVVPSTAYQTIWIPFIRRSDRLLVNSRHVANLARQAGVSAHKIHVINPGADIPVLDSSARMRFRTRHEIGERPLLLSVGRITPRKGLLEFVTNVMPCVVSEVPDALLLVIGEDAADGLHAPGGQGLRAKILDRARHLGISDALRFIPTCNDAQLSEAYQSADVHVFPIRQMKGDVEGFGMVAIEAAVHGLQTVAYEVGGVSDAIIEGRTGWLVPASDTRLMTQSLLKAMHGPLPRDGVSSAGRVFGWDRFDVEVLKALEGFDGI